MGQYLEQEYTAESNATKEDAKAELTSAKSLRGFNLSLSSSPFCQLFMAAGAIIKLSPDFCH